MQAKNAIENSIMFLREIDDIENEVDKNYKLASNFIELDKNHKIDQDTRKRIDDLKAKINSVLPQSNVHLMKVYIFYLKKIIIFYHNSRR